ncbi:MAG: hypothetical protein JNN28_08510 [Saprospiraceae bacterium]|nr:hypothetical protein [Saprospiraceae bacterium]
MKHNFSLFATIFGFLTLSISNVLAQQPGSEESGKNPSVSYQPPAEVLIKLETYGCKGYCPVYKLTFNVDGTMNYSGYRHVEEVGEKYAKLTADEFSKLKNAVRRANLWELSEELPVTVADAPYHAFTVYEKDKKRKVKGAGPLPKDLEHLNQLMKDIAENHGMMVKKGVDPNDPSNMKGEVLVQFRQDINAGNFCMQFMEMKTRPLRRVSEDNIWILGFNPSELTEAQFIDILKGMDGVINAQSNKKLQQRNN